MNNSATSSGVSTGSLHRISEDSRFRPFLTTHFDAEGFTRSAIRDGRSEDVFRDLDGLVGEVNDAIKSFVAVHKHDLMGGMQDVAVLASRYHALQALSSRAKMSVERLKKDTVEVHDLLRARTSELERIHATSTMLRQLRQFAHAIAQLNHYVNEDSTKDNKNGLKDIRQYVGAAKIVYELEQFLEVPQLQSVSLVSSNAGNIRSFGRRLREAARSRLLSALRERNQAAVADCLQIFFNLDSLPEIILLAVDNVVKSAADISMASIDLEVLVAIAPELALTSAASSSSLAAAGSVPSTPIRASASSSSLGSAGSAASASAAKKGAETNANRVASQLRSAMREIGHLWSTKLFEITLQIHVLQRVISKKEDPTTHKKFIDVLRAAASAAPPGRAADGAGAVGLTELASGDLVELFYARLIVTMHDVITDKIRKYPVAAARIYPSLRRAAAEATAELNNLSSRISGSEDIISLLSHSGGNYRSQAKTGRSTSVFGSLGWSLHDSAVGQLGFAPGLHSWNVGSQEDEETIANGESLIREMDAGDDADESLVSTAEADGSLKPGQSAHSVASDASTDRGFVGGLRPMRDRYLIGVLSRITAPIHQMFPELEGYVAAVPSKRDLQSFIKIVLAELVDAGVESNVDLMRYVCKELNKAVQLLATKIEGMIQNVPDIKKIDVGKNFARNGAQEHNAQLVTLIAQMREALEKLPAQVRKALEDSGGVSGADASNVVAAVEKIITSFNTASLQRLDDLASRQLLNPIIDCIAEHARSLLIPMLREAAVSSGPGGSVAMSPGVGALEMGSSDCSKAVQGVLKQIPEIVRVHLQSFPSMPCVAWALEELSRRLLFSFMSVVVLVRPVTELSRLRAAADMTALEVMTSTLRSSVTVVGSLAKKGPSKSQQPMDAVKAEFVALRRLLFEECISSPAASTGKAPRTPGVEAAKGIPVGGNPVPSKEAVLALPYLGALRPSTLLGYIFACGPSQLSPAYEMSSSKSVSEYLNTLCSSNMGTSSAALQGADSDPGAALSALLQALSISQGYRPRTHWTSNSAEAEAWRLMQRSLDVLFQRSSVAADDAARLSLRAWHATLTGLGETFFPPIAPSPSSSAPAST